MSQPQWSSLYTPLGAGRDALIQAVTSALTAAGAVRYDPFGLMPGLSYPRAAKLFVAPPAGDWLRLIPSPDSSLDHVIGALPLVAAAHIDADLAPSLSVYAGGQPADTLAALRPYLSDPTAFAAHLAAPKTGASGVGGVSTGALPPDIREMASKLPARQVERLMNSMTGAISKGDRADAQAALRSVDWDSGAGAWMQRLLSLLGTGERTPLDYATLSTAYRTVKRLARNPNATLYAGDSDARDAVPDALDYEPVFFGWKA